eukprot:gene15322-16899_t
MPERGNLSARNIYLVVYNTGLFLGWFGVLVSLCKGGLNARDASTTGGGRRNVFQETYSNAELLLKVSQTAALLEILHCIVKFVPSSPVLTGFQVCSRLFVLWMVTDKVPSTQSGPGVLLYLVCWSITEVIRYPYYVFNILWDAPYALLWCRYTFFFVLYPLGVLGELMTIFASLNSVKEQGIFSVQMPNILNISFSYYYFLIFVMLCYVPIFPQLYFHMIRQRKKFIGAKAKKNK